MLVNSDRVYSVISTSGVASEVDPTTSQLEGLKRLIGAVWVGTHRSEASGPLCVIHLDSPDKPDLAFLEDDWAGNWFGRPFESVTIIHDPVTVKNTEFDSITPEGPDRASRHVTDLGLSDVIAISRHPTDMTKRIVDTFEAKVFLTRENRDSDSPATMIAIKRVDNWVFPEKTGKPHWHPINSLETDTLGSRAVKSVKYGGPEPVESVC